MYTYAKGKVNIISKSIRNGTDAFLLFLAEHVADSVNRGLCNISPRN